MADKLLNIMEDIQNGISPSYLGRFHKIVNFDVSSVPGAVFPQFKLQLQYPRNTTSTYTAATFTADAGTDELTFASNIQDRIQFGQSFRFTTTGTLPAGLSLATTYYATSVSTTKIKLSTTFKNLDDGVYVNITDAGTGTHTATAEVMSAVVKIIPLYGQSSYLFAALDTNGNIWISRSGDGIWLRLPGHGSTPIFNIAFWKGYIFAFHLKTVDCYGPVNTTWSTGAWVNSAFSLESDSARHPNVTMSNDILYVGNANHVSSFEQITGQVFDPTDAGTRAATCTFSSSALDLPTYETIYSLKQLGQNLVIGTSGNEKGKIYSWDTISPSFYEPINTELSKISATVVVNGLLYFFDEYLGNIYVTNGSSVQKIANFPKSSLGAQQSLNRSITINDYDSSVIAFEDRILFGVSGTKMPGVYSFNLNTKAIVLEYTANSGSTVNVNVNCLCKRAYNYFLASITDDSISGSSYKNNIQDLIDSSSGNASNASAPYFETGFFQPGLNRQKKTFQFFEIVLTKKLTTGEVITLSYRTNRTDSYTTIGTMSFATDGAVYSKVIDNAAVQGDQIQFKVAITTVVSTTAPEIKAIYVS